MWYTDRVLKMSYNRVFIGSKDSQGQIYAKLYRKGFKHFECVMSSVHIANILACKHQRQRRPEAVGLLRSHLPTEPR